MTRRILSFGIPIVLLLAIIVFVWQLKPTAPPDAELPSASPTAELTEGHALFEAECAVCHGQAGDSDGDAAYLLFPKPRDFTSGLFKVRSTPSGQLPTDDDLLTVITNGMPGSTMPRFGHLSESDRRTLVDVVKSFSPAFKKRQPAQGITPPTAPPKSADLVARGKDVYATMMCAACHGETGRADGPSSALLTDDSGMPIRANDFTRGIYKGGGDDDDVYLRFMTGMNGTPMPSYEGLVDDRDAYALVQYVKSLSGGAEPARQPERQSLVAERIPGAVPDEPNDSRWKEVDATALGMMLLHQRPDGVASVDVRLVHDGESLSALLEWEDDSFDAGLLRYQDFGDGAAVQFALDPDATLATLTMGARNTPVNIWYWNAARQLDTTRFRDVEVVYAGMVFDDYPHAPALYPKTIENGGHQPIPSAENHEKTYLTAWGAGNAAASPVAPLPVEDLNAENFGTLTSQPTDEQNVRGTGIWDNGRWKVVFVRPLRSPDAGDVVLNAGRELAVAFAVWNGSAGDRNGQKSVTVWNSLRLAD